MFGIPAYLDDPGWFLAGLCFGSRIRFHFIKEDSMTKFGRSQTIHFLFVGLWLLAAASCAQKGTSVSEQRPSPATQNGSSVSERIAKEYGLDSYGQIEAIRYTFNIQLPGLNASRSWEWEPKTDKVSYEGKDKDGKPVKVSYLRSQLSSQPDNVKNEVDSAFHNDNYWLLLPFHVNWDKSATVTDQGSKKLPVGDGSAELIAVKYPADGGYTPGDTWELYVSKDNRIEQMVYHRGGPKKPSLVVASWEGYKKAGPLLISTDHNGTADGGAVRIFLTNVAVKLTGSENWVNAQ